MLINVAHLRHQGIDFAVFDADARTHTDEARSELLADLVVAARQHGLRVQKAALAYSSSGQVQFFGTPDLVDFLCSMGVPSWTHTLTL